MEVASKLIAFPFDPNAELNKMSEKDLNFYLSKVTFTNFELDNVGYCQVKITRDILENIIFNLMKHLNL